MLSYKIITEKNPLVLETELMKINNIVSINYATCPIIENGNTAGIIYSVLVNYEG